MKYKNFIDKEYVELCKEYGHLCFHKKVIEQKIKELESRIKGLDTLVPKAEAQDNFEKMMEKKNNEGTK